MGARGQRARILTTWSTTDDPRLDDYAARIWSGLVAGYDKRRWQAWLKFLPQALAPGGRAAAQSALDAELVRLTEAFIATGPPRPGRPGRPGPPGARRPPVAAGRRAAAGRARPAAGPADRRAYAVEFPGSL